MISFESVLGDDKLKEFDGSQLSLAANANKERRQLKFHGYEALGRHPPPPEDPDLFISEEINIQDEKLTGS